MLTYALEIVQNDLHSKLNLLLCRFNHHTGADMVKTHLKQKISINI